MLPAFNTKLVTILLPTFFVQKREQETPHGCRHLGVVVLVTHDTRNPGQDGDFGEFTI